MLRLLQSRVASACCLQGKNNLSLFLILIRMLHLPAVCKVKTTVYSIKHNAVWLHLPAVCKVKTTGGKMFYFDKKLHLPAVCKVKTTTVFPSR